MTLKTSLNWLKHSGVWIGFVLNPYHSQPDFYVKVNDKTYGKFFLELNLGLVWIRIAIDDGSLE